MQRDSDSSSTDDFVSNQSFFSDSDIDSQQSELLDDLSMPSLGVQATQASESAEAASEKCAQLRAAAEALGKAVDKANGMMLHAAQAGDAIQSIVNLKIGALILKVQ